jgi:hypothetical protein
LAAGAIANHRARGRDETGVAMHRESLMRRDRLSEIILLGFAALLLALVVLFVMDVARA